MRASLLAARESSPRPVANLRSYADDLEREALEIDTKYGRDPEPELPPQALPENAPDLPEPAAALKPPDTPE